MLLRNLLFLSVSALFWTCQKSDPRSVNAIPKGASLPMHKGLKLDTNSGVCIGNSLIAGHPWRHSGLELGILDYPDSFGQISWHLSQLTGFQWIDHGWGGQTTFQIINRFLRDAIGDTSDVGDGRGSVTLAARPTFAVVEGGANDIYYGFPLSAIEDNLTWMASVCKQNKVRCIVLNCVGEAYGFDSTMIGKIFGLNDWLASGALDTTQAIVVDINSLWNSGTYKGVSPYGNDNLHFSSLVDPDDGAHFTRAGYDSVAHIIFRVSKLAPLSEIVR
ncbi:MAG TPA: GDSL-type esterase/lipase family protein [Puia sp.]|jgi:lysophospholipase L1-like esterase|nr:GDSL-type esterase/lipase family protein [Puia sp.]